MMKKITRAELMAMFSKQQKYIEERLARDYVDGIAVFEHENGKKTACVYGAPYTIKSRQDAEEKSYYVGFGDPQKAYAYYEKPHDRDEVQTRSEQKEDRSVQKADVVSE
ncbi:MAG TPA: hypothetical protein VHC71_03695 [Hyphomicrobium sp.]|jgi:hypothetical protein|nr:hypothetical protein [Hyphomicrobium sp.]